MCLVIHVPHASTHIPADIRRTFQLDDAELERELLALTDHYVDEIVAPLATLGATIIRHQVSRLVCDPERYPHDPDECMAGIGMGAVYTMTSESHRLRPAGWTASDRETVMQTQYWPHTNAMTAAVTATLALHDKCYILDAHSFPTSPLSFEDPSLPRPQICLGHNRSNTLDPWLELWEHESRSRHFTVTRNTPFAGSYIPLPYLNDFRVQTMMIEFRRDLYMNEATGKRNVAGMKMLQDLTMACCLYLAKLSDHSV
jgi:N-formylglutamate deformylase